VSSVACAGDALAVIWPGIRKKAATTLAIVGLMGANSTFAAKMNKNLSKREAVNPRLTK